MGQVRPSAEITFAPPMRALQKLQKALFTVFAVRFQGYYPEIFPAQCLALASGKAERFIQSALREWAYGHAYLNSDQRRAALPLWNHFYNWHRPHHGIGCQTPSSRLPGDGNNVLTLHN